jgi:hypothetical protein
VLHFSRSDLIRSISFTIGDRQNIPFPNYIGSTDYSGRLFRGNAAVAATDEVPSPQWDHLTDSDAISGIPGGGTLSGSGPHADCRDLEVRADGHLLESNDGGITLRTSPADNTGLVSLLAMNPNDQKVFAFGKGTTSELFLTKDRGDNYVSESTMLDGPMPTIGAMLWSADGSYLYVAEYAGRYIAPCDFVAGDLSCAKTKVSSNSDSKNVLQLAVAPSNKNNAVAAICAGSAY